MMRIIWSPQAIEDATVISELISRDAPAASVRWLERLFAKVQLLGAHPLLGGFVAEDESHRYRQILHGSYRVIYRVDDPSRVIRINTVIHAARLLDLERLN